jgi:vacuolar-type H+-ATPase subunit D/Vma8
VDRLHLALATRGPDELEALGLPGRTVPIEVRARSVWGVEVPTLGPPPPIARTLAIRDQDAASPGPAVEAAASSFERLIELLLEAAPRELALEQLGAELVRTTRQVNRLEQRVGPGLVSQHTAIRRTLDEREREDHVRLRLLLGRFAG